MKASERRRLAGLLGALLLIAVAGCQQAAAPVAPAVLVPAPEADSFTARQARLQAYQDHLGRDPNALYRAAAAVEEGDGIGEYEGWVLASAYLRAFVDGPAAIIEFKPTATEWVAENFQGALDRPGPTVRVRKDDGTVRLQGALHVVRPLDFRAFIQD